MIESYPRFFSKEEGRIVVDDVTLKKILAFEKHKSPGLDGYTMNLFLVLFDLIGPNFVEIVSEFHLKGKVARVLNPTFIELTLKGEKQKCFNDYIPIPL